METYNHREIEQKWQKYWEENNIFKVAEDDSYPVEKRIFCLEMFPYPSGSGLHVGHLKNYVPMDTYCRFKSMNGFNVLHPMGWDAFGQPAENEAIKKGRNPRDMVPEYAAGYKKTLKLVGCSYDWEREINSSSPDYYKWTQWFFLFLYKKGLAYRGTAPINWCPSCKTGLANEEVKEGRCWRCETVVEKRPMPQWFFKITAYADRLLEDLDGLNWSDGMKEMQRDWIGRSEGAEVDFPIDGRNSHLTVFTTRPDTIFGATFMVIAPEHPLATELTTSERKAEVEAYRKKAQNETEIDRLSAERVKTGVFTGSYAVNPANGVKIPVWIADYVLMGYGTGAIMAVPGQDARDWEFAEKFGLDIIRTVQPPADFTGKAYTGDGPAINSDFLNGLHISDAKTAMIEWLETSKKGKHTINFKLRDWLISRQRYWGAPIPIIHCPACGEVPVPEEQLPVLLPDVENYQPSGTGESPLATIAEFVETTCPKCGGKAKRETDTMGGYACSSWYFFRFADPKNNNEFASRERLAYWLPVDLYAGGVEHARSHLLYSRFWTKVLYDAGIVSFEEPFLTLKNQGSLLAYTPGRKPKANEKGTVDETESLVDWIVLKPEEREAFPKDQVVWRWARMSKSKGNVVTPDEMAEKYGADSLRVYEMFVAPFEDNVMWNEEGIKGSYRFVLRVWRWLMAAKATYDSGWKNGISGDYSKGEKDIRRKLHQTLRKVGSDIDAFQFNTAVAAMMELVNDIYAWAPIDAEEKLSGSPNGGVVSEIVEVLTLLMAPFTPHMAEEVWRLLGRNETVYRISWPKFDENAARNENITAVFQINGKLRGNAEVPVGTSDDELVNVALAHENVRNYIEGKTIVKKIVVQHKLVNLVVQ